MSVRRSPPPWVRHSPRQMRLDLARRTARELGQDAVDDDVRAVWRAARAALEALDRDDDGAGSKSATGRDPGYPALPTRTPITSADR